MTSTGAAPAAAPPGRHRRLLRRWRPGRRAAIAAGILLAVRVTAALLPHPTLRARVALSRAVTAADGTLLRLTLADDGQYRMWTSLDQISPLLIQATLRYEDRHFYWHPGVNPFALARAAVATYVTGGRRIGGSTLTMQLARRLWGLSSRTPLGKLQQIARALQLEAQYSKRQILEAYLNVAPYGGNIEGAGAASLLYFRKPAAKLTLAEALTLAVIPQSPVRRAAGAPTLDRARDELLRATLAAHPGRGDESALHDWPALKAPRSVLVMPGGDPEDPAAAPGSSLRRRGPADGRRGRRGRAGGHHAGRPPAAPVRAPRARLRGARANPRHHERRGDAGRHPHHGHPRPGGIGGLLRRRHRRSGRRRAGAALAWLDAVAAGVLARHGSGRASPGHDAEGRADGLRRVQPRELRRPLRRAAVGEGRAHP